MLHKPSITALAAWAFLGALFAPTAPAAFPGANGKIAFNQSGQIRVVNPDGSGEATLRQGSSPDWSADGAAIAFEGTFSQGGIWRMPADGSSQTLVRADSDTFDGPWFYDPSWSPDGSWIAVTMEMNFTGEFLQAVVTVKSDGTGDGKSVANDAIRPSWSPGGDSIALIEAYPDFYLSRIRLDRTGYTTLYLDEVDDLDWSPDGTRIVFSTRGSPDVYVIPSTGGTPTQLTSDPATDQDPAWSPDGSQIVFSSNRDGDYEIYRMKVDGSNVVQVTHNTVSDTEPDWQPVTTGYARPKGATPLRVSLVPAYSACTAPNREHGPPLASASCNPPTQASPDLTIGSPDANGAPANFTAWARYAVIVGTPGAPDDSDVAISAQLNDVRCKSGSVANVPPCGDSNALGPTPDYVGELEARVTVRMTDRFNAAAPGGGIDPATMSDTTVAAQFACATTPSTSIGGVCPLSTSANALVPGLVKDTKRAIWQVGRIEVFDGGPDGDVETPGNSLFATQGVYVP